MDVDSPQVPLVDLHRKADEIINGLRDVDKDIKRVTGRDFSEIKRSFNQRLIRRRIAREKLPVIETTQGLTGINGSGESLDLQQPAAADQPGDTAQIIPIRSSFVAPSDPVLPNYEEVRTEVVDEESSSRNKRMFGHLLGTLKQFKVENETFMNQTSKRQEIEKKMEEKAIREHEEMIKQRRELFQLRREKQRDLRQLRRQIWVKELEEHAISHFSSLKGSILLGFSPQIYYKPSKFNEITQKLEEETRASIEKRQEEYLKEITDFTTFRKEAVNNVDTEEVVDQKLEEARSSSGSSSNDEDEVESKMLLDTAEPSASESAFPTHVPT